MTKSNKGKFAEAFHYATILFRDRSVEPEETVIKLRDLADFVSMLANGLEQMYGTSEPASAELPLEQTVSPCPACDGLSNPWSDHPNYCLICKGTGQGQN